MKKIQHILILLFMSTSYLVACDPDQTDIDGICYHTADLDVLVAFAANSGLSTEYEDVINLGGASWQNGRITNLGFYTGELSGSIPDDIGNLTELIHLYIFSSPLTGTIPPSIGSLSNLENLYINGSQLMGTIPSEIGFLEKLTTLDLRDNNLTGIIPNSICNSSTISTLVLSGNNLCEPYPTSCNISDGSQDDNCPCESGELSVNGVECFNQTDLDVLIAFATNSNLSTEYIDIINMGEQSWIGSKLTTWNCNSCSSTGPMPSNIGSLTNLTTLNLSNNNLSGTISDIVNLTNLTTLDLSNNNLSGTIPTEIGSYDLLHLDLSNNELTGTAPENICIYYNTDESYFNFDYNILCPPYPQCSNTIYQNQLPAIDNLLVSYYQDADNDGNGNPLGECPVQYCEDYPPPTGNECEGYVIGPATDDNDACDPGQERDECGVCGTTSTLDPITNCCATNNMGFANGTGPNGAVADECGVCGGLNSDCSSGQSATCPDADEYCGNCFGNNECIPQLVLTDPVIENGSFIGINTRTIRFHFSVPVNYITGGIEIDSWASLDFPFTVETEPDSIIELTLDDPLISYDELEITLNPCQIKNFRSNNNLDITYCLDTNTDVDEDIIPEGNLEPQINKEIYVSLLGDYDLDEDVDDDDLITLLNYWKTDDFSYELGPWNGEAPYLQPDNFGYDGDYDLHDLMGFVQMWNWDYNNNSDLVREIQSKSTIHYVPEYNFVNNQMTLNLENFPGDVQMLSFQLNIPRSDIKIESTVNSSKFDISLHGSHPEQGIYDWVLGSISPHENSSIDLCTILSSTADVNLKLSYKITGFDQEISSGEIDFTFHPVPEKITISPPYPNPFNPVTMIKYGLPDRSDVHIEIYNIQGRLIDKRTHLNMEAGYYTFRWDGSTQSSGIYLIRMKIADTVKNYRTLLIK